MKKLVKIVCWLGYKAVVWLPPSFFRPFPWGLRARRFFARGLLQSCGKSVNIETGAQFGSGRGIHLGDHSSIGIRAHLEWYVTIGNYVMMAPDVVILTVNHRHDDVTVPMVTQGFESFRPVVIEDDVWIGQRALILPGVRIGRGSIIGAGAVVAKSVPPYSIAVGNPARVVRSRMDPRPSGPSAPSAPSAPAALHGAPPEC